MVFTHLLNQTQAWVDICNCKNAKCGVLAGIGCSRPADEAAFVLRTFSSSPLEVEQLPSPLSLVLGGQWANYLAGGGPDQPTFGSNPQYMISTQHSTQVCECVIERAKGVTLNAYFNTGTFSIRQLVEDQGGLLTIAHHCVAVAEQVVISAVRLDVKYAVMKPPFKPEQCVGLLLAAPDKAPDGTISRKYAIKAPVEVYCNSGHANMEEAVIITTLEPETPYVLVGNTVC